LVGDETVRVVRTPIEDRAWGSGAAAGGAGTSAAPASPLGVLDPPAPPSASNPGDGRGRAIGPGARPGAEGARPGAARTAAASGPAPAARRGAALVPLRPPVRSYRWALPLAAIFALAALGVGFHDWRRGQELARTREQLAAAQQERQQLATRLQAAANAPPSPELAAQTRELETHLAMLTSPTTLVCALRPSPGARARQAAGVLYVADDHQHWYLRARKLPPPGEGRVYRLWFMIGDKPVPAGTFELVGDEAVMSSPTMPTGTTAALITVEPSSGAIERPQGPAVLYGRNMKPLSS